MKVLIAPNSMKGSLGAFDFADQVEAAFRQVSDKFEIRKLPVADGGDLTGEVLVHALNLETKEVSVNDPIGRPVKATYGIKGKLAVIEMANASGMKLLKAEELNPMKTSSYGTGQLILDAVQNGATEILLGVGGSATVDAGMGMLEALGFRFIDKNGELLKGNGKNTGSVNGIDVSELKIPKNVRIKIVCDVDNPLTGIQGAARVFGPQKGANPIMVEELEKNIFHFSGLIEKQTGIAANDVKGAGAAGGISIGLLAFQNAEIVEGANFILDAVDFNSHAQWADLVITGEGKIDSQTLNNKAPYAVALRAKQFGKQVIAIGGTVADKCSNIFDQAYSIKEDSQSLEYAIKNASYLVYMKSKQIAEKL